MKNLTKALTVDDLQKIIDVSNNITIVDIITGTPFIKIAYKLNNNNTIFINKSELIYEISLCSNDSNISLTHNPNNEDPESNQIVTKLNYLINLVMSSSDLDIDAEIDLILQ